jgi:uncharacterized protein YjaZ
MAVGYCVVRRFLDAIGMSVVGATFVPVDEIVHRSGHFG